MFLVKSTGVEFMMGHQFCGGCNGSKTRDVTVLARHSPVQNNTPADPSQFCYPFEGDLLGRWTFVELFGLHIMSIKCRVEFMPKLECYDAEASSDIESVTLLRHP